MKKFLSFLVVLTLMTQSIGISYAIQGFDPKVSAVGASLGNVQGLTPLGEGFLSNLGEKKVKVNFESITGNNAGRTMAKWTNKENFPQEFVLEKGMAVKIDEEKLDAKMIKINRVKQEKRSLERIGIDVGEVKSELKLLPDRLQLIEKVKISYTSQGQLDRIKRDVYRDEDFQNEVDKLRDLQSGIGGTKGLKSNNGKSAKGGNSSDFSELEAINKRGANIKGYGLNNVSKLPQSEEQVNDETIKGLMEFCKQKFGSNSSKCTRQKVIDELEGAEKEIEIEEKLEFSIIPPNSIGGNFDFIKMDPSDVRISRNQILEIFDNYGYALQMLEEMEEYPAGAIEAQAPRENPLTEDYCENRHSGNQSKINSCKELLEKKNQTTEEFYDKNLLNGFTFGEANSYEWSKKIKVGIWRFKKTIASASVKFYYSYGFGVRIPIKAKVGVRDSVTDDHGSSSQDYKLRIGLKTLNGNEGFYTGVGIPEEQVFEGKEFVLELGAGIQIGLRVIGDVIDFDEDIRLMTILATYFSDVLINDLGIPESEIQEVIRNNKFDKGRHFTPPFAGNDEVELIDAAVTVPVYSTGAFEVLARLILRSYLGGIVKMNCTSKNTIGGCSGAQEYNRSNTKDWNELRGQWEYNGNDRDSYRWKQFNGTATYTDEGRQEDDLGYYQNYGVTLDAFRYLPSLIVEVFAQGGARVYIPVYGRKSFWTPEIKIFSMEFSSDALALETHEGTSGNVEAFSNNRIYGTNPSIELNDPVIHFIPRGSSYSKLRITSNEGQSTYDMYTALPSDSTLSIKNPYCENAADGRRANGKKWTEDVIIWENPHEELVRFKRFTIRARGCGLNGAMTEVERRTTSLRNRAFDVTISPESDNIETNTIINLRNEFTDRGMKIKYTTDGTNPNCSNNGNLYENPFNLQSIGRVTLENVFPVTIKAIACNADNETLGLVFSKEFQVTNEVFNPRIRFDEANGAATFSATAFTHVPGYSTHIVYTGNRDELTCDSQNRVTMEGNRGNDFIYGQPQREQAEGVFFVGGAVVRAKTCIKAIAGQLVFESEIRSKTAPGGLEDDDRRFGEGMDERFRPGGDLMEEIMGGFGNPGDRFRNGIETGIREGEFTMEGVKAFSASFSAGQFDGQAVRALAGGLNPGMSNRQAMGTMQTMSYNGGQKGTNSMNKLGGFLGNGMTVKGMIRISRLFLVHGIGAPKVGTMGMQGGQWGGEEESGGDDGEDRGAWEALAELAEEREEYETCVAICVASNMPGIGVFTSGDSDEEDYESCVSRCEEEHLQNEDDEGEREVEGGENNNPPSESGSNNQQYEQCINRCLDYYADQDPIYSSMVSSRSVLMSTFGHVCGMSCRANSNSFMDESNEFDEVDNYRKYAFTRFQGCEENDIILGNQAWASCNVNYDLGGSIYYQEMGEDSTDVNGWKFGMLHDVKKISCPEGYELPDMDYMKNLSADEVRLLKIPLPGYYDMGYYYIHQNGYYYTDESSVDNGKYNAVGISNDARKVNGINDTLMGSLRCVRQELVRDNEIIEGNTYNNNNRYISISQLINGVERGTNPIGNGGPLDSDDEYINEKLSEINACFENKYSEHLEIIQSTIEDFEERKEEASEKEKGKYEKAIETMNEILEIFQRRYENILEFSE